MPARLRAALQPRLKNLPKNAPLPYEGDVERKTVRYLVQVAILLMQLPYRVEKLVVEEGKSPSVAIVELLGNSHKKDFDEATNVVSKARKQGLWG